MGVKEAELQKEEMDHINRVLARAEELNRIEETRIGYVGHVTVM